MGRLRARVQINLVLILAWLLLAGWIAYQLLNPPRVQSVLPDPGGNTSLDIEVEPFQPPQVVALDQYSETVERPLFYPNRRPEEPEPQVVVQQPVEDEPDVELTLIGVMLTDNATAALIRQEDTHQVARLNVGEAVADWELEQVAPQSVTLRKGDATRNLTLLRNQRQPSRRARVARAGRERPENQEGKPEEQTSTGGQNPKKVIEEMLRQRQQNNS